MWPPVWVVDFVPSHTMGSSIGVAVLRQSIKYPDQLIATHIWSPLSTL